MKHIIYSAVFLLATLISNINYSQCRGYSKNECIPKLDKYIHTGQLNAVKLSPGEKSEIMLTFYAGQEYKIIVCAEEVFDNIIFKIRDSKRRLIYDNLGDGSLSFNFKVASTQQLIISFKVPESESEGADEVEGCVSAIIGFKF
jgi:hypothetical protein